MSNLIEATPEGPDKGGGPNRVFVLIALGLAGLLVLGLLLVFGYILFQRLQPRPVPTPIVTEAPPVGSVTPGTPGPGTLVPGTPSPTIPSGAQTATALAPTHTPTPVLRGTNTPSGGPTQAGTATRPPSGTSVVGTPTPGQATQAPPTATATSESGAPTATPTPSDSNLPSTGGIESNLLAMGALMVVLLLIARGFRSVLR